MGGFTVAGLDTAAEGDDDDEAAGDGSSSSSSETLVTSILKVGVLLRGHGGGTQAGTRKMALLCTHPKCAALPPSTEDVHAGVVCASVCQAVEKMGHPPTKRCS